MFISKQLLTDPMLTLQKDQPVILPDIVSRKGNLPVADNDEQCKKRKSTEAYDQKEYNCFWWKNL